MFSARHRLFLSVCFLAVLAPSSLADWPHLRGPNLDGVATETGLPDVWPKAGPSILWSRDLGQGHSGFISAGGRFFTQRQSPRGQYVLCLDPSSGETVWETRVDWPWQPGGMYPGPYATPTCYRERIYFASPSGVVGCLNSRDGTTVWSCNVHDKFKGKGQEFGCAATPLVEDDRVILPVGGENASLVALHADDGRTLWEAGSDPASYCPAFPITLGSRRCVIGYLQNSFLLVDMATGKVLHRQSLSQGYDEHSAWPLYREPDLLLLAPFGAKAECWRFTSKERFRCESQWRNRDLCNDIVSSVLYQNHIFGFHLKQQQASAHKASRGLFKCLEWSTGKTCWSTDHVGQASVIVADGKLFLLNDTGTLVMARADASEYHELGRVSLFEDEICWTPPMLSRGRLVVRSPSKALCLFVGMPGERPTANAVDGFRWRFDPAWLLSRGREFPNDLFSNDETLPWFSACLLMLAVSGLFAAFVLWLAPDRSILSILVFLGTAMVLAFLGPNVFSSTLDRCLFTWPLCLYVAFHGTMISCSRNNGGRARLAVAMFLLLCLAYFAACEAVGMFIAWGFLFGFIGAAPFAYLAASTRRRWLNPIWTLSGFTAFFWSTIALLSWRA